MKRILTIFVLLAGVCHAQYPLWTDFYMAKIGDFYALSVYRTPISAWMLSDTTSLSIDTISTNVLSIDSTITIKHDSMTTARGLVIGQTSGLGSYGLRIYSDYGSVPILVGADGATNKFIFPNGGGLTLGAVSGTGLYPIYLNSIYQGAALFLSSAGNVTASGYVSGTYTDFSTTRSDSGTYYGNKFQITFNPTYNLTNVLNAASFYGRYASNSDSSSAVTSGLFQTDIDSNQYVGQVMAGRFDIKYNNTFPSGGNSLYCVKTGIEVKVNSGKIGHMMGMKVESPVYTGSLRPNVLDGIYIDNQLNCDTSSAIHIAGAGRRNAISFGNFSTTRTSRIYSDSTMNATRIVIDAQDGIVMGPDTTKATVIVDTTRGVVLKNGAILWDDITISGSAIGVGATSPTLTPYGGSTTTMAYGYQGSVANDIGYWGLQMTHRYNPGDSAGVHYHLSRDSLSGTPPGVNDSIIFVSKFFWQNTDSTEGTEYIDTLRIRAGNKAAWVHQFHPLPMRNFSNKGMSSIMTGSIQRLQNHPSDTYAGYVFIISLDAHYKLNTMGSRTELTK